MNRIVVENRARPVVITMVDAKAAAHAAPGRAQ